ncbi:hypothetical protein CC1G_02400 [Coprinopsis cinerea okayama7|uniref:DUF6534 domain-containing protein n=1 Tax=Coprinopsis cinerea (strain Okayama-7 / 130 / ATCC MYA-4618 / FGSC 9003) TaxID=240176 RepID=A8N7Z3_COPC7|nr:hypothetical protein CC1G_02400 [Coprinopsis cinerea okayama7\|eukprot:XP_001830949.2 hypothetical protein CC1G_02400 [Coprinopsis cinerea okayama7\
MSSGSFISSTVGASLVASILQTYLFGVLTFQYATYYSSGFKDPKWITYPMGLIFLMTAFHCLSLLYMTWYYSIENYGNPESLLRPKIWPFPLSAIMTTLTAYVTQLFLTYRAYRLTQNFFLVIPLVLVSTAAMVLGIIQGAMVWMLSSIEELSTLNATLTAWLTLEVAADWLIAGVLLWAIRASRTTYRRSGRVVKRLFRTAVQTGLIASAFASVTMILYLAFPNTEYVLITGVPIGCVYAGTLMDTLLCRKVLRNMISDIQLHSEPVFSTEKSTRNTTSGPNIQLQVRKEHETVLHFDAPTQNEIDHSATLAESEIDHDDRGSSVKLGSPV